MYGFLGLMCYHLLGFFTYFEWKRLSIHTEVKHALKQAVPEHQLTHFHFTAHEMHRLKWVKSHEFMLNGHYYDVVKKERTKNGFFFRCISDDQETELFAQLRTMTSFNLSQTGKNHPIHVWFKFLTEPMVVMHSVVWYDSHFILEAQKNTIQKNRSFLSPILFPLTPPPNFIS